MSTADILKRCGFNSVQEAQMSAERYRINDAKTDRAPSLEIDEDLSESIFEGRDAECGNDAGNLGIMEDLVYNGFREAW